eukprot:Gregarina_sp_Poly_1__2579@NODE_16_length_22882_cov_82_653956_g14_i0_p1_GENE_NODE_16_length_22882_cov_82_653956_g14_i0NODE_16_length_22882_cov_82_653956_g14_i0_p1_ORF_typecomplete_len2599_score358_74zfHC5HC2H_2/PF13832_6/4_5e03zfHC5HC2H_2/PF13832_6/1_8e16zfHC5HC2H_2/PF13832_6/1_4e03zfHC5HC2H_2/PF13832_6/7_5e06zfHC5HC2H_2/PF13832_6/0_0047zfHC5HC2H_2/PF13832_6/1_8e04zfHC5HC2H_2/PF13832_6/0_00015PHD_2/PF13831_6/2_4e10PHD_2/PF13831_6/1_3e04PHD_2/PF13831_6/7_4e03PHD_2/PF13831_6/8_3e11PHD_2/PF13831_6/1
MYFHSTPSPRSAANLPALEAAHKFGGLTSSFMTSSSPSGSSPSLPFVSGAGGQKSALKKELTNGAIPGGGGDPTDELFGHATPSSLVIAAASYGTSVGDTSKSRKRSAHVMETDSGTEAAESAPRAASGSPKRSAWFTSDAVDTNYAPTSAGAITWSLLAPSTRASPNVCCRGLSQDKPSDAASFEAASRCSACEGGSLPPTQQFVSPSASHAKTPPTSHSPASGSEGLQSSIPPPVGEPPPPNNSNQLPCEPSSGSALDDVSNKSPWWSLTNAATNQPSQPPTQADVNSLWDQSSSRVSAPPGASSSTVRLSPVLPVGGGDRQPSLSSLSTPRLDHFGVVRGGAAGTHMRLPGLPEQSERLRASPGGFEYLLSANQPPQLPPLRPPRSAHQGPFPADGVDDRCEVCWDNEETQSNPIISCKGCAVKVHQQCYGVCRNEQKQEWYCAVCLYWRQIGVTSWYPRPEEDCGMSADASSARDCRPNCPAPLLYCVLCNRPKGAMKIGCEGRWVHVACVLYSQDGPTFRDIATRSNPMNIEKNLVTHNRNRYSCSICRSAEGYTTNCSFPGCLKRVHVACVFANGHRPKLQTISADVPLYPNAFLCQLPGSSSAEPAETRVVEKLVKIITCETHASENAYNAVELYEKKLLKKTDLSAAPPGAPPSEGFLPPPLHGPFLTASESGAGGRPPGTAPPPEQSGNLATTQPLMGPSPHGVSAAPLSGRLPVPTAQNSQQPGLWQPPTTQSLYQQYAGAAPYRLPNGMYLPGAGYPLAASSPYYLPTAWHMNAYGGYHAYRGYGPQYSSMYAAGDVRPVPSQQYPYWPSSSTYGSTLNRHHSGFSRVNSGGPRGACGINKSRSLLNREEGKSTPAGGARKKDATSDMRPVGMGASPSGRRPKSSKAGGQAGLRVKPDVGTPSAAMTKLVQKPAQMPSLVPKQKKAEAFSPRAADDDASRKSSVKTQKKKASARVASTTSAAASAAQRRESKARVSGARRRLDDEDDLGTASGHVIGAALSTRGFRVNWARVDAHFRSIRSAGQADPLSNYVTRIDRSVENRPPLTTWSWVLEEPSEAENLSSLAVNDQNKEDSEATLNDLRSIWLDNCTTTPVAPEAPLTVVISAKVPGGEVTGNRCHGAWTFWSVETSPQDAEESVSAPVVGDPDSGRQTPVRKANICEDSSSCLLTLSPSPLTEKSKDIAKDSKESKKESCIPPEGVSLHLIQAYTLNSRHVTCLRQRHGVSRAELAAARSECAMTESPPTINRCLSSDIVSVPKGTLMPPMSPEFTQLLERAQSGHEDPTSCRQETETQPRRKPSVDAANWNEILRIESSLVKRYPVPPFFMLLKKLPQDVGRGSAVGASSHAAAVQKLMSHKENVAFTLDPAAPRRVVTASKKFYLHGRIWDLNPSFPAAEVLFRSRLPAGSVSVMSSTFKEAVQSLGCQQVSPVIQAIPIPDETSREWLAAAQKVRLASTSSAESSLLSEQDKQTAAHGEDLIKVLITEGYWRRLMFQDDFVKRQALFTLMVWAKKRSRLKILKDKLLVVMQEETRQVTRLADQESAVEMLRRQSENTFRWSAFRAAVLAGHQDPGSALVARVEAEYNQSNPSSEDGAAVASATAAKVYFCLVCFGTELDNLNPLVTCTRCGIKVHKNCYGVGQPAQLDLDIMEWYCDRCEAEKKMVPEFKPNSCRCFLCLRFGGALRKFAGQAFMHITCALWAYPVLTCSNLYRLSQWKLRPQQAAPKPVCLFCSRNVEEHVLNGTRKRRPLRDKVVRVFEDEDEDDGMTDEASPADTGVLSNKPSAQSLYQSYVDDKATAELPLGTRGLPVKCSHHDCNECFHPLCGWLRGLRVVAFDNFFQSVAPNASDPFLPSIDIKAYCEIHTPLYSPESRLPMDVISKHRVRAYVTKEEDDLASTITPHIPAPAAAIDLPAAASIQVVPPIEAPVTEAGKDLQPLAPETFLQTEHPSGTSRRPSLNQDLLKGLLTSAAEPTGPEETPTTHMCAVTLAGRDVYAEDRCQACLGTFADLEDALRCPECAVRVHAECSKSVFPEAFPQKKTLHHLCCSCLQGGTVHCALCPRLGGALCQVPQAALARLFGETPLKATYLLNGVKSPPTSNVHKICLLTHIKSEDQAEFEDRLMAVMSEEAQHADLVEKIRQLVSLVAPVEKDTAADKCCEICGISEGCCVPCSERSCDKQAHMSCAGIAGCLKRSIIGRERRPSAAEDVPAIKKRRLSEFEKVRFLCLRHKTESDLEESGARPWIEHYLRTRSLRAQLSAMADLAEEVSERQRKQRELVEQFMSSGVGFGLTKLDASYGISYEHTNEITQFVASVDMTAAPGKTGTLASAKPDHSDRAANLAATLEESHPEERTPLQESSSDALLAGESRLTSALDEIAERLDGTQHTSSHTLAIAASSKSVAADTRCISLHSGPQPQRVIGQLPPNPASVEAELLNGPALLGELPTRLRNGLDVNPMALLRKESISQATTTASSSDIGRRKRKRTIVDDAESDDEPLATAETRPPSRRATVTEDDLFAPPSSGTETAPRRLNPARRRSSPKNKAPPRQRSKGGTETSSSKKRRVSSLPLRNERGQFVRRVAAVSRKD